ncbi:spore coat protein [Clostridium sp. BJN0001]|uniref:spore coat protein n=1 Tax=Clostridium sp. BJN0001 TaxID=2930219 RepID=UPI001FD0A5C1|nr:spore coat protein [Clostridium sp. BJN0001]
MLNLNQKESMFLQDEKKHEELCVKKYDSYSQKACDPKLKSLFTTLKSNEENHLNTINQMLSGTVPSVSSGSSSQNSSSSMQSQANQSNQQASQTNQAQSQANSMQSMQSQSSSSNAYSSGNTASSQDIDKTLCNDALSTEKYVSSTYNTAIFEFRDPNARQVLNHIQKEEQEHGEQIYNYMSANGLYS